MDKYIVYETVNGHYAVRPSEWTCILNEKGQITEACNHTGLFHQKEEADKFAEWKNAEENGMLFRLPCKIGDTVYRVSNKYTKCSAYNEEFDEYNCQGCECLECDSKKEYYIEQINADGVNWILHNVERFGVTIFISESEAKKKLRKSGVLNHELLAVLPTQPPPRQSSRRLHHTGNDKSIGYAVG